MGREYKEDRAQLIALASDWLVRLDAGDADAEDFERWRGADPRRAAAFAEVAATSSMKLSEGFTRPGWSIATAVGYGVAFYCLSLTLKTVPTGVAYAIWSGVGIVLISLIAWLFQGQKLDAPAILGMALIVAGVAVMNLFSKAGAH